MNDDFIFHPPRIPPNPLAEIAEELAGQRQLNREFVEMHKELTATLKDVVHQQRTMSEQLLKVAQWIDSHPQ